MVITKDKGEAEEVSKVGDLCRARMRRRPLNGSRLKAVAAEEAAASVKAEETQAIKARQQKQVATPVLISRTTHYQ